MTAPPATTSGPAYADRYEDVRVSAETVRINPNTSLPHIITFGSGRALGFDKATNEGVTYNVQIPHSIKKGTLLYPHVHWSPIDTDTGVVRWGLAYDKADVDEVFTAGLTVYAEQAGAGAARTHQQAIFPPFANGIGLSTMFVCTLFRDGEHENDTYDNDAAFLEFDFHILIDSLGSREEFVK